MRSVRAALGKPPKYSKASIKQRIKVCTQIVKEATEYEAFVQKQVDKGFASQLAAVQAKAAVVEAQIMLEQAKLKVEKK